MAVVMLGFILLFIYLSCMVTLIQYKGDTSIANFTWGGGVLLVTLYTFFKMSSFLSRQILITSLIALWAVRLIIYIYIRYTGKDPRFASWKWQGSQALFINIAWVFGQIFLIAIMSYPALVVNTNNTQNSLTVLDFLGLALWVFGYFFESISDYQLYTFMHNPNNKGKVMRFGLWHYSRHPNYFGESAMWWGIFLVALSAPYGWTTVIAPAVITILLVFVTGIPWVEAAMANNPEYQEYKQKTSMFVPWFAKK